jgi:DNA-binding SARP family transcriptional activator
VSLQISPKHANQEPSTGVGPITSSQEGFGRALAGTPLPGRSVAATFEIAVLGPLVIRSGAEEQPVTAALPRRILGLLALYFPGPIGIDELIDTVWEQPPKSARNLINVYVRQIRSLLEPERVTGSVSHSVAHSRDGLQLTVTPEQLDLARFDDLCVRASSGRTAALARAGDSEQCR